MKKTLLLLLVTISVLSFSSCKKTCDCELPNNSIIGKWQIETYTITNFENTGKDQDDTKGEIKRPTLEFKQDGSLKAIFYFYDTVIKKDIIEEVNLKYTISGDKLNLSGDLAFNHDSFNFSISNNILILKRTDISSIAQGSITPQPHTENTTITSIKL